MPIKKADKKNNCYNQHQTSATCSDNRTFCQRFTALFLLRAFKIVIDYCNYYNKYKNSKHLQPHCFYFRYKIAQGNRYFNPLKNNSFRQRLRNSEDVKKTFCFEWRTFAAAKAWSEALRLRYFFCLQKKGKKTVEDIYANQNLFSVFVTLWLPNIRTETRELR